MPRGSDSGASEVVGSILMVALTVTLAAAMVAVVYGALPSGDGPNRASLTASIHPNEDGWGSGDETVRVSHKGGNALPRSSLAVLVSIAGTETRFTDGGTDLLDHAGEDAFSAGDQRFVIGERWETPTMTIPADTRLSVTVVDTSAEETLWTASFRSSEGSATSASYVQTPLGMVTGTATNDANARSASDGDASATLTEAATGSTPSTETRYGTTSSGTANNVVNAEDAPDDQYTQFQAQNEHAEVGGFAGGTGTISQVEIALEGRHDGNQDAGAIDQMRLSHDLGSTSQAYPLTTEDTQHFLDVTGDRSWTWTDVEALDVRATCECHQVPSDNRQFLVDALWVRVTTTEDTYELETDAWTFDPLGGSGSHELEIRYQAGGPEAYQVEIWDGSTWNARSPILDQPSYTTFSHTLASAEVAAGPQLRIVDQGAAQTTQGTLDLDHVRVVTS